MATTTTTKELRNMTPADLAKEIRAKENEVVKLRLGVKLGKEKDSAKYIRERKQLARMKTVHSELNAAPTKETKETASKEAKKSVSSRGSTTKSTSSSKK